MNLRRRSYENELLDRGDIPFEDIKRNMQELNFINTYLGGHAITINGLKQLIGNRKQIHICETGCGGGDNLAAIVRWCNLHAIKVVFTGVDINAHCIEFARTRNELQHCTNWIISDYKKVLFDTKPDIIFSSLFCHHFTETQLIDQLQWMKKNATTGFFINDLQRHFLAYYSIKILTHLFSRSYLVKNDAPLSVARGFTKNEWIKIFEDAHIHAPAIKWKWAFRYLIIFRHNE